MRDPQMESEVFRAYRMTRSGVEQMTKGELLGALNRVIVEMTVRDQSVVIIEQLQMQIDFLLAMPERKKAPRKKRRVWKFWDYGVPINYSWNEVDEGQHIPAADKTLAVDTAIDTAIETGTTIADVELDPDDAPPGVQIDHTYERQKIQDAIEEAAEADAEFKREAALFEADLVALAANQEGRE